MMPKPYRIWTGDAREQLENLPDQSVHCVVTSPPFWGLRDYGVDGQLGLEPTPGEYVAGMVGVFGAVWRVLRDDGTLWLNLGDSYSGSGKGGGSGEDKQASNRGTLKGHNAGFVPAGLKPKDLCGIPWRVAFALQACGWYLRSDIIWSKPNPMPESCTDRPTKAHEYIFLLTKSPQYYYDAQAIREQGSGTSGGACFGKQSQDTKGTGAQSRTYDRPEYSTRNARSVWRITTQPYPEAHFATFPEALPERCIRAGTSEKGCCANCGMPLERVVEVPQQGKPDPNAAKAHGGVGNNLGGQRHQDWREAHPAQTTGWKVQCGCINEPDDAALAPCMVLDPFSGSGTTGVVACKLGRNYTGIELNPEYATMSERRISKALNPTTFVDDREIEPSPLFGSGNK